MYLHRDVISGTNRCFRDACSESFLTVVCRFLEKISAFIDTTGIVFIYFEIFLAQLLRKCKFSWGITLRITGGFFFFFYWLNSQKYVRKRIANTGTIFWTSYRFLHFKDIIMRIYFIVENIIVLIADLGGSKMAATVHHVRLH